MLKKHWKLSLLSIVVFLYSCATARVEVPVYEGVDVKDVLYAKNTISTIETTLSLAFEREDVELRGEGLLSISRTGDLSLRVYSLGFLALELTSEKGITKSNPWLHVNKRELLANGLHDCFFWWDIEDSEIDEKEDVYLLKNQSRMIWIDRKTILPLRQTIYCEDGTELNIFYERPERAGDVWYPSKIRIEIPKYSVTLKIKKILFNPPV